MWYNIRTHRHYTITHIMRCTHTRSVQEAIRQVPKRGPAQLCLKRADSLVQRQARGPTRNTVYTVYLPIVPLGICDVIRVLLYLSITILLYRVVHLGRLTLLSIFLSSIIYYYVAAVV